MINYTITDSDSSADASGYDQFLSVSDIKTYLNVDASTDDTLLGDIRDAVCAYSEKQFKQSLKGNKIELYIKDENYCELMFRPVTSIDSIAYTDESDASGTLEPSAETFFGLFNSRNSNVVYSPTSSYKTITITFTSNGSSVPLDMKYAILAHIKQVYDDNRQFIGEEIPMIPPAETIMLMNSYKPIVI